MAISNIKATLPYDVKKVWDLVTSLENYSWRSDISKIEVLSDNKFVEYTKDGYATTFTTTAMETYRRWEFKIENDNISGHWIGLFSPKDDKTTIDFTEDITAKKIFMRPFLGIYLRKQQWSYVRDLERALKDSSR